MDGNKTCIYDFLEEMQHEFPEHNGIEVNRAGFKVDGQGIKYHCKLNTLKSVDYFEVNDKHGFVLVEFSDLLRQNEQIEKTIKDIKESNITPCQRTKLIREQYKKINQELVSKYKDSITLNKLMHSSVENIPPELNSVGKYVVVVTPQDKSLPNSTQMDIHRFLDTLKDKIRNSIPKELYTSVVVLHLDTFCS